MKKTSTINGIAISIFNDKKILEYAVSKSTSFTEAARFYTSSVTGSNTRTLRKYIKLFNISTQHFRKEKRLLKFENPLTQLKKTLC
jgi:hypothetical protein